MNEPDRDRGPETPHHLRPILDALTDREPLFHRRAIINSRADFDRETSEDFWEVTASGRRMSREEVWSVLAERYAAGDVDEFEAEGWELRDPRVHQIAPTTYLFTYTLWGQGDRLTRRLSVWQGGTALGWQVLYHQGTVVQRQES